MYVGMGRLIAIHGYRGFKAHGSVHRRQFVYRGFFLDFFFNGASLSLVWAIFRSNQWSTTGLSKAVVCTVLCMEKCI